MLTKPTTRILAVSQDAKTTKGEKRGYLSGVNYMAQGDTSGYEVCAGRTDACFLQCLGGEGTRGVYAVHPCQPYCQDTMVL